MRAAISQLVCDHFAYADGFDAAAQRYVGLTATGGHHAIDPSGLLVKPEAALAQIGEDLPPSRHPQVMARRARANVRRQARSAGLPRRFYASVTIDPNRAGRDVGRIAEEVLQHLTIRRGANVRITLDVEADVPEGIPDDVQRVVTENCQTLRFTSHGFERG